MATHSSIPAWRIPHGQRSLTGYSPWVPTESGMTEQLRAAAQHRRWLGWKGICPTLSLRAWSQLRHTLAVQLRQITSGPFSSCLGQMRMLFTLVFPTSSQWRNRGHNRCDQIKASCYYLKALGVVCTTRMTTGTLLHYASAG